MIRRLIAICLMLFAAPLAMADIREIYTVRDISVDEQAGSIIEAREKAMNAARVAGAKQLINKITLSEDRNRAGGIAIDLATAQRLSAAVDVQEETAGAGRYRGKLAVVFNPRMVRAHLDTLKIPYVDTQAPLALMVPATSVASAQTAWRNAFPASNNAALAPYTKATGSYSTASDWTAIASELTTARARRGALAELEGREGAWRVKLSILTAEGKEAVGTTGAVPTIETAARAASLYLDETWKKTSIIRDTVRTLADAEVLYTSLPEWNTLRGALSRSPLVSELKIRGVARGGALVSFNYAGDFQRLRSDLSQRGVSVSQNGAGFTMRSAVSPSGTP